MAQKKLIRFTQLSELPNVMEKPEGMKGKWRAHFKNENPIILELACGRGEYTIGLAAMHPEQNFIGIDIKGNRMYLGAKKALAQNLNNAAFLRTEIEKLTDYFTKGEIAEIWITFPDPQTRTSKAKKRLTYPRFLRLYRQVLEVGGTIHLKTDSPELYKFTRVVIDRYELALHEYCEDVYKESTMPELKIRTHYEGLDIARSNKIFYLNFSLPEELKDTDNELKIYLQETENQLVVDK